MDTVPRSLHMENIRCLVAATTLFDLFFVSSQLSIFSSGSQKYVCGCSTPPLLYTIFKYIVEFVFSMNMHETLGTVRKTSDNQSITHCDDMVNTNIATLLTFHYSLTSSSSFLICCLSFMNSKSVLSN